MIGELAAFWQSCNALQRVLAVAGALCVLAWLGTCAFMLDTLLGYGPGGRPPRGKV